MPKAATFFAVPVVLLLAATTQAKLTSETPQRPAFVRLDRVTASRPIPNGIEIHSGPAILQITALRDDVLRVRVGPAGQLPEDASWAVLPESREAAVPVTQESSSATIGFKTGKLRLSLHRDPFGLQVPDLAGRQAPGQSSTVFTGKRGTSFQAKARGASSPRASTRSRLR